jgi:glycosyltransferase involved in cell wall biosynthesis
MIHDISVIIPARNEAALIGATIEAALAAACAAGAVAVEVIVVDNGSSDGTPDIVRRYACEHQVRLLASNRDGAPCARNDGARLASGRILVFLDADTLIPRHALRRIAHLCDSGGCDAGITRLASREGGFRAALWWGFWNAVRLLPLPRAKAMPALMFCTRAAFDRFGPFDERVRIGEEWPILAGVYGHDRRRFRYERRITALTSSRRMDLQPFGYTRTFWKYVWAVLHLSGRVSYGAHVRHRPPAGAEGYDDDAELHDSIYGRTAERGGP